MSSQKQLSRQGLFGSFRKISLLYSSDSRARGFSMLDADSGSANQEKKRLVFFGCGDSGKSVLSQRYMIYVQPTLEPSISPSLARSKLIYNILEEAKCLLEVQAKMDIDLLDSVKQMLQVHASTEFTEFVHLIRQIAALPKFQQICYDSFSTYRQAKPRRLCKLVDQLKDLSDMDLLKYNPSLDDLLLSVSSTTGLSSSACVTENKDLIEVYDVGGNRAERRKWSIVLNTMKAETLPQKAVGVFCVSLADFSAPLFEDSNDTRLKESLKTFKKFFNTDENPLHKVYIAFTKMDLLGETLEQRGCREYLKEMGFSLKKVEDEQHEVKLWLEQLFLDQVKDMKDLHAEGFFSTCFLSSFQKCSVDEFSAQIFNEFV